LIGPAGGLLDVLEPAEGVERHRTVVDEELAGEVEGRRGKEAHRVGDHHDHLGGRAIAGDRRISEGEAVMQLRDFG
jgi:hypothetical protein